MKQFTTITSKRQLTIPVRIFHEAGLRKGQKVIITQKDGKIYIKPAVAVVEELAGSVDIPPRFKSIPIEEIIKRAKEGYYKKKV